MSRLGEWNELLPDGYDDGALPPLIRQPSPAALPDITGQLASYVKQLGVIVAALQRRMDEMEKENARKVTVSHAQALALSRAMTARAKAICDQYRLTGEGDEKAFRAAIKKAVLTGFCVKDLHDLPLAAQDAAIHKIESYTSIALVMERRNKNGAEDFKA